MNFPAADEEYPSVFLALLTNRHWGGSGNVNFCFAAVGMPDDSSSPMADAADGDTSSAILLFAEMMPIVSADTNASFVVESTPSLEVVGGPSIVIRSSVDIRFDRKS
jgi:hypothetical protein